MFPPSPYTMEDFRRVRAEAVAEREAARGGGGGGDGGSVLERVRKSIGKMYNPGLPVRRRDRAWTFLARCREQARDRRFVDNCGVPDALQAKLGLMTLHMWMIKVRLSELRHHPERVDEDEHTLGDVFALFYEHVEMRIFNDGTPSLLLSKRIRELEERVYGNMIAYDSCLEWFLKGNGNGPFLGALWRNVHLSQEGTDTAQLVQLLDYVIYEINSAQRVPAAQFLDADYRFGEPPPSPPPPHAYRPSIDQFKAPLVTSETVKEARAAQKAARERR